MKAAPTNGWAGAAAAPIVKEFFETEKKDIKAIIDPPKDDIPVAEPVERPENGRGRSSGNGAGRLPSCRTTCRPVCMIRKGWSRSRLMKSPADLDDSSDAEIKANPGGRLLKACRPSAPPLSEEPSAAPPHAAPG